MQYLDGMVIKLQRFAAILFNFSPITTLKPLPRKLNTSGRRKKIIKIELPAHTSAFDDKERDSSNKPEH